MVTRGVEHMDRELEGNLLVGLVPSKRGIPGEIVSKSRKCKGYFRPPRKEAISSGPHGGDRSYGRPAGASASPLGENSSGCPQVGKPRPRVARGPSFAFHRDHGCPSPGAPSK